MINIESQYNTSLSKLNDIENYIRQQILVKKISNTLMHCEKIEELNKITKDLNNAHIHYNAIIISLYGIFENYLDETAKAYIESLRGYSKDLCFIGKSFENNYYNKFGEYLSSPQRYTVPMQSRNDVINRISKNIEGKEDLLYEFALRHSGNMTGLKVVDFLNNLDMQVTFKIICDCAEMKDQFTPEELIALERKGHDKALQKLDSLVEARNNVAHGVADQIISMDFILHQYIPFIKSLIQAINAIFQKRYVLKLIQHGAYKNLGKIYIVYNNNIACIVDFNYDINVSDIIVCKKGDIIKKANIVSLQVNNVNYEIINFKCDVGIMLDQKIDKDYELYVLLKKKKIKRKRRITKIRLVNKFVANIIAVNYNAFGKYVL